MFKNKNTKEIAKKEVAKSYHLRALWSFFKRNKLAFFIVLIFSVIANILISLVPFFTGKLFGLGASTVIENKKIFELLLIILGLNVLHGITWAIGDFAFMKKLIPVSYKFREIATTSIIKKYPYKKYVEMPPSKISNSTVDLSNNVTSLVDNFIYSYTTTLISLATFVLSAAIVNSLNLFIYLFWIVVLILNSRRLMVDLKKASANYADKRSSINGAYFDVISNYVNLKSFNAEDLEINRTTKNNNRLKKAHIWQDYELIRFWRGAASIVRLCLWTSIILVNYLMYANGKISFSDLAVSISILIMFSAQIWDLVGMVGNLSRDMGVLKQNYNYIFNGINIVEEYYQKEDSSLSLENIKFNNVLEVKGLNFAYPDRPEVQALTNIDLVIKKNEKIGIVGRSGSGKSTLVKLLLGFYEYEEGSFLVDGRSISRSQIATLNSYVPQDTSLFQESIEYNIKYGQKREIGIEEVKEAAKKAHADEFIDKLKDGYKTNIGERGVKLSLGQRQRIAIARAFLNKNDLLILDEATSALDSKTEKLVQESLEQLWDSKTVIAIAHRLSTLNNVDRIVVMDKGRIVEVGTKTELLASKGIFAELWKHQKDGLLIED